MKEQEKMIARLYCKLRRELHTYAARYCPDEAEDIVHQAFLNGYNKIVEERNEAEQRSYLYSTVKNLCLNFIRNSRPVYMDALPDLMTEFIVADNRTQVRNTRAYLLASLFNSVSTLDNQCTMQYNYNLGGSW